MTCWSNLLRYTQQPKCLLVYQNLNFEIRWRREGISDALDDNRIGPIGRLLWFHYIPWQRGKEFTSRIEAQVNHGNYSMKGLDNKTGCVRLLLIFWWYVCFFHIPGYLTHMTLWYWYAKPIQFDYHTQCFVQSHARRRRVVEMWGAVGGDRIDIHT